MNVRADTTPTRCFECDGEWEQPWDRICVGCKIYCPRCNAPALVVDEDRPYYIRTRAVKSGE